VKLYGVEYSIEEGRLKDTCVFCSPRLHPDVRPVDSGQNHIVHCLAIVIVSDNKYKIKLCRKILNAVPSGRSV